MTNTTMGQGGCPSPFLQLSKFPEHGGFLEGRFCAPAPSPQGEIDCCLPCPMTDWVYADNFSTLPTVSSWLNVAGFVCSSMLLLSFVVLPLEKTGRHYLTIGLVASVCILQLGFIIPLGAKPDQCYNAITPNDMYSDLTCAFSGACLLAGGFAAIIWGFLRSLSLHLQICWQVIPGRKLFWSSFIAGCTLPILFAALALGITGVSYRFGDTCHINHEKALADYWGPMLAFAAVATILQFTTFGFCLRIYIRSIFKDDPTSSNHSALPSYTSSVRTVTAGQAFLRIKKAIALQWRGIVIVLIIIGNVIFLAVVFVSMDNSTQDAKKDLSKAQPWLLCLVMSGGDKNECLDKASGLVIDQSTAMAVLIVLSLNGIWTLLFLGRISMAAAWINLVRRPFSRSHDFVSIDARRFSADPRSYEKYEMITSPPTTLVTLKTPEPVVTSPPTDSALSEFSPSAKTDYFGKEITYNSPTLSFSTPRPPSAGRLSGRTLSFSSPRPPNLQRLSERTMSLSSEKTYTFSSQSPPSAKGWDPSSTHAASFQGQKSSSSGRF